MRRLAAIVSALLLLLYPLAIFFGLARWGARGAALVLLVLLIPSLLLRARRGNPASPPASPLQNLRWIPLLVALLLVLGATLNRAGFLFAMPIAINAVLLVAFATTLASPPPMIERFARLIDPDLSTAEQRWCRAWTLVWCAFFANNIIVATTLALLAPLRWWTLYNGLIAYLLLGSLVAVEWLWRKLRFGRWRNHGPEAWVARHLAGRKPWVNKLPLGEAERR